MRKTLCLFVFAALPLSAQINVQGGNQTLTITTGVAGGQPLAVVNTASSLRYRQDKNDITKVTVQTSCPGQKFSLRALAVSPALGTPAPEAQLTDGMLALDFITSIPTGNKFQNATILYTASASFSDGNSAELGNDVHTVTYTLLVQ